MKDNRINFWKYIKAFYGTFALIIFAFLTCLAFTLIFHVWGFIIIACLILAIYYMFYYVFSMLYSAYVDAVEEQRKRQAEEQLEEIQKLKKYKEQEIDFFKINQNK